MPQVFKVGSYIRCGSQSSELFTIIAEEQNVQKALQYAGEILRWADDIVNEY